MKEYRIVQAPPPGNARHEKGLAGELNELAAQGWSFAALLDTGRWGSTSELRVTYLLERVKEETDGPA